MKKGFTGLLISLVIFYTQNSFSCGSILMDQSVARQFSIPVPAYDNLAIMRKLAQTFPFGFHTGTGLGKKKGYGICLESQSSFADEGGYGNWVLLDGYWEEGKTFAKIRMKEPFELRLESNITEFFESENLVILEVNHHNRLTLSSQQIGGQMVNTIQIQNRRYRFLPYAEGLLFSSTHKFMPSVELQGGDY